MASWFRSSIAVLCVAIAAAFTLPARLFDAVGRFLFSWPDPRVLRFLSDLTRGPALVLAGPGQCQLEPARYQRNRHEAGLAVLGSVRHR